MFSSLASVVVLALTGLLAISPAAEREAPSASCEVQQARITWGFKESFRSYLSGAIALGKWTTSGDVSYQTPVFIFATTNGSIAADRSSGEVPFEGEFRFRAHGGILNTALSNPTLRILGPGEAALFLDVTGETMGGLAVSSKAVDFVRISWPARAQSIDAAAGVWTIQNARVVLTPLGANAFGTYVSGEVFDPMTIELTVTPGCLNQPGWRWWWLPGGVLLLAIVGAAVAALVIRANKSRGLERQSPGGFSDQN